MPMTILSVAYPLAPVGPDAVGGAEQILCRLDAALVRAGHNSIIVAREDSETSGHLAGVPEEGGLLDEVATHRARLRHREAIAAALRRWPVDLIHLHGIDFHTYLPPPGLPVLVTLHLPLEAYSAAALNSSRPDTWFNCVSASQARRATSMPRLVPAIENGVDVDDFALTRQRRGYALMLVRICPEKGVHLALQAARQADIPLLIAGETFPYAWHRQYFDTEVRPLLDRRRRYLGPASLRAKKRLLASACCVLIPSLVDETSSLVAREAAAAGTPVIAFARGALPDTVRDGETGYIVDTVEEMAAAIHRLDAIDAEACRSLARQQFSATDMAERYMALYADLVARQNRTALGE